MSKTSRKSTKEVKLQQYLHGFYGCLAMFEEAFRDAAWKEDSRQIY